MTEAHTPTGQSGEDMRTICDEEVILPDSLSAISAEIADIQSICLDSRNMGMVHRGLDVIIKRLALLQAPHPAPSVEGGYYATDPRSGGGGEYWIAEIEVTGGHYMAAEVYGDDKEEVSARCKSILAALNPQSPAPAARREEIARIIADGLAEDVGYFPPWNGAGDGWKNRLQTIADQILALCTPSAGPAWEGIESSIDE